MKAVILQENGGIEKLIYTTEHPVPQIKANEVLVNIKATTINRADLVIRNGYPGLSLKFPHILGGDISGVVAKTGSDVKDFKEGDRVVVWSIVSEAPDEWARKGKAGQSPSWQYFGMHRQGSYAEYTPVPESSLIKLPDNVSFEEAACLPVAGLTAYHAVMTVGDLNKGDTMFIWGGTSGVGTIAIQLAKARGAEVFATAGFEHKLKHLEQMGVDHIYNHRNGESIDDKVLEETKGHGIDVIVDYVGPEAFPKNFKMVKKGGKILFCGILTGREAMVSLHQTYLRHISLLGMYLGEKRELEELVKLIASGNVKPHIGETLELKDAAKAHQLMAEGKVIGKIVLRV
ncbi:MAG: alcohol dehydrogenase [Ignavibacteriae bacterium]|nr:MAG: alcohol dehydrogenase [Ignavibacteriota bacterium]